MNKREREELIMKALTKFKVCSRNQLAFLACQTNSLPTNVVNRVLKRMSLNGAITQIQRERDKPYLYMPNPTLIHPRTVKIDHYLKLVDVFISSNCPSTFLPEPTFGEYKPDIYMKDKKEVPLCVEVQITPISTKKMQTKIDQFQAMYGREHDAKILLLVSNNAYDKVKVPDGFKLARIGIPKEIYT